MTVTSFEDTPDESFVVRDRPVLRILWDHRWLLVAVVACCQAIAVIASATADERYTAEAQLLFRDPGLSRTLFGSGVFEGSVDPERNAATNVEVIESPAVADRVRDALGYPSNAFRDDVDVTSTRNADVVSISATEATPARAAALANAYARQYIVYQRETDRQKLRDARRLVDQALTTATPTERAGLVESARQLRVLEALQTGDADLIGPASAPAHPSSPDPVRNALIALAAGLVLGGALALLSPLVDRKLKSVEDVERAFGYPVIAQIPRGAAEELGVEHTRGLADEPYRLLREAIRPHQDAYAQRCLVVTSAEASEGKTTVATNLARMLAAAGESVILVEADLRRPRTAIPLAQSQSAGVGVSGVLTWHADVETELLEVEGVPNMKVLPAGRPPDNAADIVRSPRMADLLRQALALAGHVIIDAPPLVVSDAHALLARDPVDGVLLVARAGHTRRDRATAVRRLFARNRQHVLGVVLTDVHMDPTDPYYGPHDGDATDGRAKREDVGPRRRRLIRS